MQLASWFASIVQYAFFGCWDEGLLRRISDNTLPQQKRVVYKKFLYIVCNVPHNHITFPTVQLRVPGASHYLPALGYWLTSGLHQENPFFLKRKVCGSMILHGAAVQHTSNLSQHMLFHCIHRDYYGKLTFPASRKIGGA